MCVCDVRTLCIVRRLYYDLIFYICMFCFVCTNVCVYVRYVMYACMLLLCFVGMHFCDYVMYACVYACVIMYVVL